MHEKTTIIQVPAIILTKKDNSQHHQVKEPSLKPCWMLCYVEFFVKNVSEMMCEIVLVFFRLWIVGKTKKHLVDLTRPNVPSST